MIIFSWINAQNILFQLPLKIILFGGRSDSCIQGDKIAQNESSRALHATWLISLNAATATECVVKKQRGDAGN